MLGRLAIWALSGALALLLAQPREAWAGRAEALLHRGKQRYAMGDYRGALMSFSRARKATTDPKLQGAIYLFMGLTLTVLERPILAEEAFATALKNNPDLSLDPRRHKKEPLLLFDRVRKQLHGVLVLQDGIGGSAVEVDGVLLGRAPFEGRLAIGTHQVVVLGPRGRRYSQSVVIYPDQSTLVMTDFSQGEQARASDIGVQTRHGQPSRRRVWTWVLTGMAAVTAGVGLGMYFWADDIYTDQWIKLDGERSRTEEQERELDDIGESIYSKETAAYVMLAMAGVLAVSAVATYYLEGRPGRRRGPASRKVTGQPVPLLPLVSPSGGGLALGSVF